jgi:zinc and cadmium transporter
MTLGLTLVLFCAAIVAASVLGGLLPLATVLTHTRLQVYLSFASGTMLGAAFFHMLPEAVEEGGVGTLRWTAAGLLALFFLERFFAYHHHETGDAHAPGRPHGHGPEPHDHDHGPAPHNHATGRKASALHWGAAAFGLAAHTLIGGVALASASAAGAARGLGPTAWGVFLATLVHKPADSLTIVSLMVRSGASRALAHAVNLGFALMLPLGVAAFFLGRAWAGQAASAGFTASALGFSAGTFLCVSLSDLLPELQFHEHDRLVLSAALLAGFGLMAGASYWG